MLYLAGLVTLLSQVLPSRLAQQVLLVEVELHFRNIVVPAVVRANPAFGSLLHVLVVVLLIDYFSIPLGLGHI